MASSTNQHFNGNNFSWESDQALASALFAWHPDVTWYRFLNKIISTKPLLCGAFPWNPYSEMKGAFLAR